MNEMEEISNEAASLIDREIDSKITKGEIDALIFMSADPNGANKYAVESAVKKNCRQPERAAPRWPLSLQKE
jgi:hypothetical protein